MGETQPTRTARPTASPFATILARYALPPAQPVPAIQEIEDRPENQTSLAQPLQAPWETNADWDADRAACFLAECEAAIDAGLTSANLTPSQLAVAAVLRDVVRSHAAAHDPLLWDNLAFLTEKIAEWKALNADAARRPSTAPPQVSFRNNPRPEGLWRTGDEPDLLDLVKELFPPKGIAPKVEDWRPTRQGGAL